MKIHEASVTYKVVSQGPAQLVDTPQRITDYLVGAFDSNPEQEQVYVVLLNKRNYAKGRHLVSLGTLDSSLIGVREVFRAAILGSAAAIVLAHNHPSGDPSPSGSDVAITRQLREAGKIMGIPMLDHVIVGDPEADPCKLGHYSFRSAGLV